MNIVLSHFCRLTLLEGLSLLVQSTLLTVAGLLVAAVVGRRSPHARAFALRVTLLGVVLGSALTLCLSKQVQPLWSYDLSGPIAPYVQADTNFSAFLAEEYSSAVIIRGPYKRSAQANPHHSRSTNPAPRSFVANGSPGVSAKQTPRPASGPSGIGSDVCDCLALAWVLGALLLILRVEVSWLRLVQMARRARHVTDMATIEKLTRLAEQMGVRPPKILASSQIHSPFLAGFWRPAIFLPESWQSDYDSETLHVILAHELAHAKRHDLFWTWTLRLTTAFLWIQPLLWLLGRQLEQSAEEACDLVAITTDCPPTRYADCLLRLSELTAPSGPARSLGAGVVPVKTLVGRRIHKILRWRTRTVRNTSLILASAITLGAVTAAIAGATLFAAYQPPTQSDSPFANVPMFMQVINSSPDPVSVAAKRDIADGPDDLAHEEALARAAGISLAPPVKTMPPPSLNAAPLYNKWQEARKEDHVLEPEFFESMNDRFTYTPAQIAQAEAFLAKEQNAFQYLHEALTKPDLVYSNVTFMHWADLREAAREVESESYLLAYKGEYQKAIEHQALGFNIARQLASDPELYNDITACATNAEATEGMESILDMAGPNAALDQMAMNLIVKDEPKMSLKPALIAQLPHNIATLQKMQTTSPAEFANMNAVHASAITTFTPQQQTFVQNWVDAAEAQDIALTLKIIALPDQSASDRHQLMESELQQYPAINPVSDLDPLIAEFHDYNGPTAGFTIPTPDQQFALLHARQQVLSAAALVMADKAATGQYPDQLPAKYVDPFSGKPLPYERHGASGFAVYSIGIKGNFQPGDEMEQGYGLLSSADFSYPPPPPHAISNDGTMIK